MTRRRPSTGALAAAAIVVIASLTALVVLPVIMMKRTERYRTESEKHAEPARAALNEINYRLSQQIASLTRAAVAGEERHIAAYRGAIAPQDVAMESLARHRGVLGREFDLRFVELEEQIGRWHTAVQESSDSQALASRPDYPAVIEAVHRLDEAITAFQSSRRQQVARLTRIQVWLTAGLGFLATVAATIVLWMIARLRSLTFVLEEESKARQAALEREQQLVRIRDEILGVVSHDLRSPLTTIALSAQLIPRGSEKERTEYVETISGAAKRMERLIEDLLDVTKIDNTALSMKQDIVDPVAVGKQVIASHEPIAASKRIDLQAAIDEALPEIRGDRDRLVQALGNLIGNAFKFTPAGGTVRLSVQQRDGKVRFVVTDTGPGIAPSDLPHLFEPFWQAKKTAHLGAGLGLKITRAIVDAHHGSIEVTNWKGGGACFAFELPIT
jgi:signal transduction histidine kinase